MTAKLTKSILTVCTLTLLTAPVLAQPKRRGNPPPPPPPAAHEAPAPAPAPGIPAMDATSQVMIATPSADSGSMPADHTLLQKETEVRRAFHVEAFADLEAALVNRTDWPNRGFTLNDSAIYLSKDFGRGLSAMIDLPFASTTVTGANASYVTFGAAKAQAFVQYLNGPWQSKFGQYDTIFGYEKNDSRDRFFANAGLVKAQIVPTTHVGVLGCYSINALSLRAQLTDMADTTSMANANPELGLQARFDGNPVFGAIGFSLADSKVASGSNQLIDFNAGVNMNQVTGAVYFDDKKIAGVDKHSDGFGLQAIYAQSPDLGLGARIEYTTDTANTKSELGLSVGPSYRWMPDVTLRGDADFASLSPVTGDNISVFGAQFSLVAGF